MSLTNLTTLLPRPHDYIHYVSRPILTPPPLWMQKNTDLRAHDFVHCYHLWHQPRLANITCNRGWRLYRINRALLSKNNPSYAVCSFRPKQSNVNRRWTRQAAISKERRFVPFAWKCRCSFWHDSESLLANQDLMNNTHLSHLTSLRPTFCTP